MGGKDGMGDFPRSGIAPFGAFYRPGSLQSTDGTPWTGGQFFMRQGRHRACHPLRQIDDL